MTSWIVRIGDDRYIRSACGRVSAWFHGARVRQEGRIQAGGVEKGVTFLGPDPELNNEINAAYRTKCRGHRAQYVNMMLSL